MPSRAGDWFRQAERDLEQAVASQTDGRHEWACFAAQQAAEKAVKALHLHLGEDAWGHTVAMLLRLLPADVQPPSDLIDRAQALDLFYIPARYPDSYPEGAPFEHFGLLQSKEAVQYAGAIVDFVRAHLAEPANG
ncbi:MAG: HEPN domain-containing protein [Chloroflexota bacterium]